MVDLALLESLLDAMPLGCVVLDEDARVVFYNRYEEQLADRVREDVIGRAFFEEVAPCTQVIRLGEHFAAGFGSDRLVLTTHFHFPKPNLQRPRDVRLQLAPLKVAGRDLGVLFVEDVTPIRAIERTKDFLVQTMAHDMNNPLAVIQGALHLAAEEDDFEARRRLERQIAESADRLRRMLLDLHDITRLSTRASVVELAPVDLFSVSQAAVEAARTRGARDHVSIVLRPPTGELTVVADGELVRRAMDNLVDNAIRVSPAGGTVTVTLARQGECAVCEVRDEGPGVPDELRRRIFHPFVSDDGRGAEDGPHGLGLALVDMVAREHGGEVEVTCPERGGSVFSLALPVEAV